MTWLIIGMLCIALSGVPGLLYDRRSDGGERPAAVLVVAGCLACLAGIVGALLHGGAELQLAWAVPAGRFALRVDALAAAFLLPLLLVVATGAVYGLGYWPQREHPDNGRKLRLFYGLISAAMILLLCARNGVLFLVAWEVMALAGFFLITTEDRRAEVRRAGYIYLIATHTGTLALFGLFALLGHATGSALWPAAGTLPAAGSSRPVSARAVRLRHEGRADAAAHLASRRPCRRPQPCLGAPLRGDDQDRHLRAGAPHLPVRRHSPLVGLDAAADRRGLGHPRRRSGPRPARHQAAARLPQRREHRHHRHGPGPGPARPQLRPAAAGPARPGRLPAARRQPRPVQVAPLFERRLGDPRHRQPRPRPFRRPAQAAALDRPVLSRRGGGDQRAPPLQRLHQRMADLPRRLPCRRPSRPGALPGAPGGSGAGADRRPGAGLLRQGLRRRPSSAHPAPRSANRPTRRRPRCWRRWRCCWRPAPGSACCREAWRRCWPPRPATGPAARCHP